MAELTKVKTPQSKARARKDGAAIPLDAADKRLMNVMQSEFPLVPEPYARIAERAEMPVDEVMSRARHLLDNRIIREITPIFDTRTLGDLRVGLGDERELGLHDVHQPLVGGVERNRGAVLAGPRFRLRGLHLGQLSHWAASFA